MGDNGAEEIHWISGYPKTGNHWLDRSAEGDLIDEMAAELFREISKCVVEILDVPDAAGRNELHARINIISGAKPDR